MSAERGPFQTLILTSDIPSDEIGIRLFLAPIVLLLGIGKDLTDNLGQVVIGGTLTFAGMTTVFLVTLTSLLASVQKKVLTES